MTESTECGACSTPITGHTFIAYLKQMDFNSFSKNILFAIKNCGQKNSHSYYLLENHGQTELLLLALLLFMPPLLFTLMKLLELPTLAERVQPLRDANEQNETTENYS